MPQLCSSPTAVLPLSRAEIILGKQSCWLDDIKQCPYMFRAQAPNQTLRKIEMSDGSLNNVENFSHTVLRRNISSIRRYSKTKYNFHW